MANLLQLQENALAGSGRQSASYFRRRASRAPVGEDVYILWSCDGHEGLSRIRDLGSCGLFIESPIEQELGAPMKLHFLADEGQIRASAAVRHVKRGQGVGLKLIAINHQDSQRLAGLMKRVGTDQELCLTGAAGQQNSTDGLASNSS
jgi:hypothetical protein